MPHRLPMPFPCDLLPILSPNSPANPGWAVATRLNPLWVVTRGQRHKPRRAHQRQRHKPSTRQSMVNWRVQVLWQPNIFVLCLHFLSIWDRTSLVFWDWTSHFLLFFQIGQGFPRLWRVGHLNIMVFTWSACPIWDRTSMFFWDRTSIFPFFFLTFFEIGQGFPRFWSVAIPNMLVSWRFYRPIWDQTMYEVRSQKKWKNEGENGPRSKLTPRKQTKSVALWSNSCGTRRLRG